MSVLGNNLLAQYYAQNSLSAKSYVQDGLIAMWDGIENIGWGKHDNNTTTWKNLVGNVDFTMIFNNWGWESNCFLFDNSSAETTAPIMSSVMTMECCFEHDIISNRVLVLRGDASNCKMLVYNQNSNEGLGYYFDGDNSPSPIVLSNGTIKTLTALWDNPNGRSSKRYKNGVESTNQSTHASLWSREQTTIIGGDSRNGSYKYGAKGKIYCLRLYNRVLSNDEILQNYNIDKTRFNF